MATTTDSQTTVRTGPRASVPAALDVMLTDAALEQGVARRFLAPGSAAKAAAGLARRPRRVASRVGALGAELARVAAGSSELSPGKGDRRFADRGWRENWLLHRVMQGYLAVGGTVDGLVSEAELDWRTERQARFAAGNVLDALAPTNFPWSNPAVIREIVDTGGANLVKGARRFARDISRPPRLPATVDTSKFEVGKNLAVTPGSVVMRTDVFELLQYRPQTEGVRELPLLFVPPTINKYYVLDLAPGRSMTEYLAAEGFQVFAISWRNPDAGQAHFDLDTYAEAVLEALAAVAKISDRESVHIAAACSGGIITAGAVNHISVGEPEAASVTLMVCALDNARAGDTSALATRELAAAAVAESARRGYLDGRALAGVFAWLRPNDLIWGNSSTTTCWARSHRRSMSFTGIRTACDWRPGCTATSSGSRSGTRWSNPVRWRCSETRSTWRRSSWTATWSRAQATTSSRGRTRIAAPSCWVGSRGSCSRRAATFRR